MRHLRLATIERCKLKQRRSGKARLEASCEIVAPLPRRIEIYGESLGGFTIPFPSFNPSAGRLVFKTQREPELQHRIPRFDRFGAASRPPPTRPVRMGCLELETVLSLTPCFCRSPAPIGQNPRRFLTVATNVSPYFWHPRGSAPASGPQSQPLSSSQPQVCQKSTPSRSADRKTTDLPSPSAMEPGVTR